MLWLGLDASSLTEALAHLLYTDKQNPFMIWVPLHESGERNWKQEQQQIPLDVSCSFMSIANSKKAYHDGMHPCLAPPTPLHSSSAPSIPEVSAPSRLLAPLERVFLMLHHLQILSFFPVLSLPLPSDCQLPHPPSSQRLRKAMPTPTCLLSELTVGISRTFSPLFLFRHISCSVHSAHMMARCPSLLTGTSCPLLHWQGRRRVASLATHSKNCLRHWG